MLLKQSKWLLKDLEVAQDDRNEVPWIILLTHLPLYCSGDSRCSEEAERVKDYIEDFLIDFKVDLVIQSYAQHYERTSPVIEDEVVGLMQSNVYLSPDAPVYVLVGSDGGASPEGEWGKWTRCREPGGGIGELVIYNSTHLQYNHYIDEKQVDYVLIQK